MISRYRDGQLAAVQGSESMRTELAGLGAAVTERLDAWDLTGALEAIWKVVRRLNAYVEETKPWELAKDEAGGGALDDVLYDLADGLRGVAVALAACVPSTSDAIREALGRPTGIDWENVAPGRTGRLEG